MEPMTEEQKKKMLQKAKANAYKKRKSKIAMQKESRNTEYKLKERKY